MEEWRVVEGWPYEVSDRGRVRRTTPAMGTRPGTILGFQKGWGAQMGYHSVMLRDHPKARWFLVHRLVATAFLGPAPFKGAIINHLSGVKLDNRPENLEWTDRAGNNAHAGKIGLVSHGDDHWLAKLSTETVRVARQRYADGESNTVRLAAEFGVSSASMYNALTGKTWKHAGGPIATVVPNRRGENHPLAKLCGSEVASIKHRLQCGETVKAIASDYPRVTITCLYDIAAGRTWGHIE